MPLLVTVGPKSAIPPELFRLKSELQAEAAIVAAYHPFRTLKSLTRMREYKAMIPSR
jgi:hypothetical protein